MTDSANNTETDAAFYKTLLESTKAIPWKLDWKSMQFAYIGPQIESLLGWPPSSWKSVDDWAARMHPDDRDWVLNYCVAQSQAGTDHEADYRALAKDGHYVWLRDVVHVIRNDQGEVEALVGFMFDISERKQNEEKLLRLQHELEELSFKDSLTGISNRRRFDSVMAVEWAHARRNRQPLSLILFDVDYFKQYNDLYGHVQGDECLIRVARAVSEAASRPRDLLARYGGEEFVLVLPETDAVSAEKIAERCRLLLLNARITHAKSPVEQVVTISLGVGSIIPEQNDLAIDFIEQVDRRLYQAKQKGRNTIVAGG